MCFVYIIIILSGSFAGWTSCWRLCCQSFFHLLKGMVGLFWIFVVKLVYLAWVKLASSLRSATSFTSRNPFGRLRIFFVLKWKCQIVFDQTPVAYFASLFSLKHSKISYRLAIFWVGLGSNLTPVGY